jgi:hypothetical protein
MNTIPTLLTRDTFRESVFSRDSHKCVVCKEKAQDAHHIIERRLFPDGGYYLDNGASLCGPCHIAAEETVISCDKIREAAGIKHVILPPHLYKDHKYDKWGNPVLANGQRLRGELFFDLSVQKIIKPVLDLFTKYVKYPRTYHLPWSPGMTKDDRVIEDLSHLEGVEVIVTLKLDGENCTWYRDYLHARSLEYDPHPSRNYVKAMHGKHAHEIPDGWRICGENVYAKHSIHYHNLETYFYVFSIWNDKNACLSWDETIEWCGLFGLKHVPVLYRGVWDEKLIRSLYKDKYGDNEMEGYVVRVARSFEYGEFRKVAAKYVRSGHVTTSHNWKRQQVIPNELEHE